MLRRQTLLSGVPHVAAFAAVGLRFDCLSALACTPSPRLTMPSTQRRRRSRSQSDRKPGPCFGRVQSHTAGAHAELGKLCLRIGEPARAVTHLRTAIALTPTDRSATYSLLMALRQAGLEAETAAVAARLRELIAQEHDDEVRRNRFRLLKAEDSR